MRYLTKKQIALLGLGLSIIVFWWTIQTTQASVDYWLEKPETFKAGLNSITVYCKNGGQADGDFTLILHFVNASFSKQTAQPYIQVDDSTIKSRFLLHKGESNQKTIYFTTHEKVNSFSINLNAEKTNFYDVIKLNAIYPTELEYVWNKQENIFVPKT